MKNLAIKAVFSKLENANIQISQYEEGDILCGYELNTYTSAGVNQILFIDFRGNGMNPESGKDFVKLFNERVNDINIDDEIELNRQDKLYREDFTIEESIQDFKEWKENLLSIFDERTAEQKQFEQVTDKLRSQISEMEETLKLMPQKGNNPTNCQRTSIYSTLNELDSKINSIELEDFIANEYSNDFKLSYS